LFYSGGARHWGKRERYVLSLGSWNYLRKEFYPEIKFKDIMQA
jgi:hypothetical protein